MDIIFADPVTTVLILMAIVGVAIVIGQLRRRGQDGASTPTAAPSATAAASQGIMALETRFGWLSEDARPLLQNSDRALRQTANTALDAKYRGEYAEAIRLYRACLTRPNNTPQETATMLTLLGNCFLEQGKMEQAAGHYREASDVVATALGRPV